MTQERDMLLARCAEYEQGRYVLATVGASSSITLIADVELVDSALCVPDLPEVKR